MKKLNSKVGDSSLDILADENYLRTILQFLVLEDLSHTKLLEKVVIIYVFNIYSLYCQVKLNCIFSYKPQNKIDEIFLDHRLKEYIFRSIIIYLTDNPSYFPITSYFRLLTTEL